MSLPKVASFSQCGKRTNKPCSASRLGTASSRAGRHEAAWIARQLFHFTAYMHIHPELQHELDRHFDRFVVVTHGLNDKAAIYWIYEQYFTQIRHYTNKA